MHNILFIDRYGTMIDEPITDKQVDILAKLVLEPQLLQSLLKLQNTWLRLVMVSNKDGLCTTSFTKDDLDASQNMIMQILESQGVVFDEVLLYHHFDHENCRCRKLKLGLVK